MIEVVKADFVIKVDGHEVGFEFSENGLRIDFLSKPEPVDVKELDHVTAIGNRLAGCLEDIEAEAVHAVLLDAEHREALADATKALNRRRGTSWPECEALKLAVVAFYTATLTSSDEQLHDVSGLDLDTIKKAMEHPLFDAHVHVMRSAMKDAGQAMDEGLEELRDQPKPPSRH